MMARTTKIARRNHRRSTLASAVFSLGLVVALGACGSDKPSPDDCETNADCPNPFQEQCVDGQCVPLDAGTDTGDAGGDAAGDADTGDDVRPDVPNDTADTTDVPDETTPVEVGPDTDTEVQDEPPPLREICDDFVDNTGNGLIDCLDPDCEGEEVCEEPEVEICDDEIDNDDDGLIDCLDPECVDERVCKDEDPDPEQLINPWIAYVSFQSADIPFDRIFITRLSRPIGEQPFVVDTGDPIQVEPAWSRDGRRLAFRAQGPSPQPLRIVDVTTGEVETIEHGISFWTNPTWGPGEDEITVEGRMSTETGVRTDLYRIPLDGSGAVRLTSTPDISEVTPQWVRSSRMVYGSNVQQPGLSEGGFDVVRWNRITRVEDYITTGLQITSRMAMDFFEERVVVRRRVFRESDEGPVEGGELVVVDAETGEFFAIGGESAQDPAISPDGNWVVFADRVAEDAASLQLVAHDARSGDRLATVGVVTSGGLSKRTPAVAPVESDDVPLFWNGGE